MTSPAEQQLDEAIFQMFCEGTPVRHIKETFRCGQKRIYDVLAHYLNGDPVRHTPGPRKKTTESVIRIIEFVTLQNASMSTRELRIMLEHQYGITLGVTRINDARHFLKFNYKPPKIIQDLNDEQKQWRIWFAQQILDGGWDRFPPKHVLFSDEAKFELTDDRGYVWRRHGERNPSSMSHHRKQAASVMVFGAIGNKVKSKLVFVEGSINAKDYIRVLKESKAIARATKAHGLNNFYFMQDGARCHTCQTSVQEIYEQCRLLPFWPANSPDFNPIESFWGCMKRILKTMIIRTVEELKNVLNDIWDRFDQDSIDRLCASFPARLQACINVSGESIQPYVSANNLVVYGPPLAYLRRPPTPDEDAKILKAVKTLGHKWKLIATHIEDRTPHWIETRWHCMDNERMLREFIARHVHDPIIAATEAETDQDAVAQDEAQHRSVPLVVRVGKKNKAPLPVPSEGSQPPASRPRVRSTQPSTPPALRLEEWRTDPQKYFYRSRLPGEQIAVGPWSQEECEQFFHRLAYFNQLGIHNRLWGLFAVPISNRVGYQCYHMYQMLLASGHIADDRVQVTMGPTGHPRTAPWPVVPAETVDRLTTEALAFLAQKTAQNTQMNQ
jgi:transposase